MKINSLLIKSGDKDLLISKVSLIIAIFLESIAGYAYFAFIPRFLYSKGFPEGQVIFIMIWMGIGMAIFSWIFGKISDRTGRRRFFFILALFFQVIILSLLNLSNHIIFYCVLNFLRGIILGMQMPASNALFADIVENSKKKDKFISGLETIEVTGIQLSLLNATKSTGWAIGVLLSSTLIGIFGVDSLVLFLIITTALSLVIAIPVRDIKKQEIDNLESNIEITEERILDIKSTTVSNGNPQKKSKVKLILYVSVFFRQFGVIPFIQIISILLYTAGIADEVAGLIIALNPILQAAAMVINGRIIDHPKISEKLMLAIGFALSTLTLLCYGVGTSTGLIVYFIIGQISLGFGWGCIYTGGLKYIVNKAPLDRAFYMGIWITDLQIAKIASYQLFTFVWIWFTPTMTLPFVALIPLIGVILVYWL